MERNKTDKREVAYRMREQGYTLQAISDALGVTKQRVAQYLTGTKYGAGKHYRKLNSIYPNLANWMYEKNMCVANMVIEMGYTYNTDVALRVRGILTGRLDIEMSEIKKILDITGMTFEECFKEVEDAVG